MKRRRSLRSPRRLDLKHKSLAPIPLDDKAPPPHDSISWKLWLECQDLAREALKTDYIQGIRGGHLDPNTYGQYTVQDAVYCHHGQEDYKALQSRASALGHPTLAAFAEARYDSYVAYTAETFEAWHIKEPHAIAPGPAARAYIDLEHRIAAEWEPIYGLIAMIPCDQLWAHLATELKSSAGPENVYRFWIEENADWGGAYRLDNFIDGWFADHAEAFDDRLALFVFRSCMTCEVNLFRSACAQEPLAMPERKAL